MSGDYDIRPHKKIIHMVNTNTTAVDAPQEIANDSAHAIKQQREAIIHALDVLRKKGSTIMQVYSTSELPMPGINLESAKTYSAMVNLAKKYLKGHATMIAQGDHNGVSLGYLVAIRVAGETAAVVIISRPLTKHALATLNIGASLVPFSHTGKQSVKDQSHTLAEKTHASGTFAVA